MNRDDEIAFVLDCTPLTLVPLIPVEDDETEEQSEQA